VTIRCPSLLVRMWGKSEKQSGAASCLGLTHRDLFTLPRYVPVWTLVLEGRVTVLVFWMGI